MKYLRKPEEVDAVQWTGSNQAEILEFCHELFAEDPAHSLISFAEGEGLRLRNKDGAGWSENVAVGDYIIKDPEYDYGYGFTTLGAVAFNDDFIPAPSDIQKSTIHNPQSPISSSLSVKPLDGLFVVQVPILLEIPVDPLDGFTEEEAPQVALDRLKELELTVDLGGVPLEVSSPYPLFTDAAEDQPAIA